MHNLKFSVISCYLAMMLIVASSGYADNTYHSLASGCFSQDWSNTGLITANDDWSGAPSIVGYMGKEDSTSFTDVDPQIVLSDETTVDVNANKSDPSGTSFFTGGVSEFEIINPTIAIKGSGNADAPFILLHLDATGVSHILISYNVRDIDASDRDTVSQLALQYRIGTSGNFTNIPEGYIADATTGPSLATKVTPIIIILPSAVNNQPQVQIRIITTNAFDTDEFIGIDDISVCAVPEINVKQGTTDIPSTAGSYNFTNVTIGSNASAIFTIQNLGTANLNFTGTPKVTISGTDASDFTVISQPDSPIAGGNETSFEIRFTPSSIGAKTATVSIDNNDVTNSPYRFNLTGNGINVTSASITGIDSVSALTALAKGTAAGDGITERGFFWWTDGGFTSGTVPAGGSGAGNFSMTLTNLKPQTTYKISAYIRIGNQLITSGNFLTFTTTEPHIPTVHTDTDNYTISNTDLTLSGEITDIGSSPVTIYGFVYAAHPYPTVWDMALPFTWDMTLPISSGKSFIGTIRNLSPGKYYVRAYAHNSIGTAYGEEFGIIIRGQNTRPTADVQTVNMIENTEVTIILSGQDDDNDPLTYTISKLPAKGMLYQMIADGGRGEEINNIPFLVSSRNQMLIYAAGDGSGSDSFGFKVNDGLGDSAEALITINIAAMNHAPMITAQTFNIAKNTPKGTIVGAVAASDPDGDILTYSIVSDNESEVFAIDPASGQISVSDVSMLDAGTVMLTVRVGDSYLSAEAVMTITISNIIPVASDDTYRTDQGVMLSVSAPGVLANDKDDDGDALTASILAFPHNGTLKLDADGSFMYMPDGHFIGTDHFTYTAGDNDAVSDAAIVSIVVNPVIIVIPDPPVIPEVPAVPPAITILNHAPMLYPDIARLTLKAIDENIADKDNPGMLISDLIDIIPDPITDEDAGAVEGIAVIDAEHINGVWQYGDSGQFMDFPKDISEKNSLLLKDNMLIRFMPNPGFADTAKLVFRAWDQTSGRNTEQADTTNNGSSTAFSKDIGEMTIQIIPALKNIQPIDKDAEIEEIPADNTSPATPPVITFPPSETQQPSTVIPLTEIFQQTSIPETPAVPESHAAVYENGDSGSGCFINAVLSDSRE